MRHLLVFFILVLGFLPKANADAGNCVKYEVAVELIDGQKTQGFIYVLGYHVKFQFDESSFLDYLKRNNPSDTLHIYKNVRQLVFPTTSYGTEKCIFHFDATTADNDVKILKSDIKSIELVSYTVCNNCDVANEERGYYWNGIYPTIIMELTHSEIDLLQTEPFATVSFGHDGASNPGAYWMVSYSSDYINADLDRLKNDFLREISKLVKEENWPVVQDIYAKLKHDLIKKEVVLFQVTYAL